MHAHHCGRLSCEVRNPAFIHSSNSSTRPRFRAPACPDVASPVSLAQLVQYNNTLVVFDRILSDGLAFLVRANGSLLLLGLSFLL